MTPYRLMNETQLREKVRRLCQLAGVVVQYYPDSRRCWQPGWPDLELLGTAILHRELKRQSGSPTPEQWRVGELIERAGGRWGVWRPSDLYDGTIAAQVARISPLPLFEFSCEDIDAILHG